MLSNVVARKKSTGEYGIYEKYRKGTYKAKTIWFDSEILDDEDDEDENDLLIWDEVGVITEQGTTELKKYGMADTFDFPKPTYLIKKVLSIGSNIDSICIDFFSGSGTLADAVMQLNHQEGNRQYIVVQLPLNLNDKLDSTPLTEKPKVKKVIDFLDLNGYPHTLDYVGFERIIRAGKKIQSENPLFHGDLGFKHFTLQEPATKLLEQIDKFDPKLEFEQGSIFNANNSLAESFSISTILATWLVRDGYGLTPDVEELDLGGYKAYYVGKHLYLVNPTLTNEAVDALLAKYQTETDFNPMNIVIYGYVFSWSELQGLKDNLQQVQAGEKNLRINYDIRY